MRRLRWILLAAVMLGAPAPAHAAPVIAAIASFVATSLPFISAAVDTFVFYAVQAALYVSLSYGLNKLFGPKSASLAAQQRQASVLSLTIGEGPREAIFGRAATGGLLLDAFNFGGANKTDWEVLVVKLADHRCDAYEGFFIGDTFTAFAGNGVQPDFSGQLEVHFFDGSPGQAASAYLLANSPNRLYGTAWTADDVCASQAYVVFAYKADAPNATAPVWPQGRPQFKSVVRGKLCYDPRHDSTVAGGSGAQRWDDPATWAWSENAAVCDYNYDRGIYAEDQVSDPTQLLIGRGLSAEEAPPERLAARANLCDEAVTLLAGGTEPRYRVGGVVFANETFKDVKQKFADATGGAIVKRQGGVEILPGAAQSVVRELTDLDFVVGEAFSYQPFLSDNDRVNVVIPRYVAPDQLWASVAAPIRRSTADIVADGGQKTADAPLDLVTSQTQAQRIGEIKRRLARKEKRAAGVLTPPHADLEDGDWVGLTSDRYFQGGRVVFQISAYGVQQSWRNNIVVTEIGADCFAWTAAADESVPGNAPVDEFGSLDPVALAGVAMDPLALTSADGTIQPAIKATWTTPVDPAIRGVRLEVRKVGTTDATLSETKDPNAGQLVTTDGVISGDDMEARVAPLGIDGRAVTVSAWIPVTTDALAVAGIEAAIGDGFLTPGEKLFVIPAIHGLVAARATLDARAGNLGVSHAAFDAASATLDAELATLNAPVNWDDSSDKTVVPSPAALKAALEGAIAAEKALQAAILAGTQVSGQNRLRFTDFEKGTGFWNDGDNPAALSRSKTTGVTGTVPFLQFSATATAAAQEVSVFTDGDRFAVTPGEQLAVSALLGSTNSQARFGVQFWDAAGAFVSTSIGFFFPVNTAFPTLGQEMVIVPAGAVRAYLEVYIVSQAAGVMTGKVGQPYVIGVPVGQTGFPAYVKGASNSDGADPTAGNIAGGITGQGPLATSPLTATQVTNTLIPTAAPNRLRFTDFEKAVFPWTNGTNPSGLSRASTTGSTGGIAFLQFSATATAAAQEVSMFTSGDVFAVTPGEQLAVSMVVGATNGQIKYAVQFLNASGTVFSTSTGFFFAAGCAFPTLGQEMVAVPAGAVSAYLEVYIDSTAAGSMVAKVGQPYVMGVPVGQTTFPAYARGASNTSGADVTAGNIAGGISGQGALATKSAVDLATADVSNKLASNINYTGGAGTVDSLKPAQAGADPTALHIAGGFTGQGLWATYGGLVPANVAGQVQFITNGGLMKDYRGILPNYAINGAAARSAQPLSSTSSTISVAAHSITVPQPGVGTFGEQTLSIPSNTFSGLGSDTTYTVLYNAGTWVAADATAAIVYKASPDGWYEVGTIRTQTSGGTYNPINYGSGGVQDYCVSVDAWVGERLRARDVVVGSPLLMMAPSGQAAFAGAVERIVFARARLLRFRTAAGAVLTVSDTAPVMTRAGAGALPHAISAAEVRIGTPVPVALGWDARIPLWEPVTAIEDLGEGEVARISAGDGIFAAADDPAGPAIFTHNSYQKP